MTGLQVISRSEPDDDRHEVTISGRDLTDVRSTACPSDDIWSRLAAGELLPDAIRNVREHADECEGCHLLLVGLDLAIDKLDANAEEHATGATKSRILEEGTRVGRYVIVAPLGEGGMGVVYRAYDPELARGVALKLLKPAVSGREDRELASRLQREARAMARLSHANVVTVHDVGAHEEALYIAMELVQGSTLASCLERGKLSLSEIVCYFRDVALGLAAAHERGIVHRDLKPQNILVSSDGVVKITDFGLARHAGETLDEVHLDVLPDTTPDAWETLRSTVLTRTGQIVGTPAYMAPEQFLGTATDARTDVFAFGVGLHEAVFRVRPFSGTSFPELRANVVRNRRIRMPRSRDRASASLARLIDHCLSPSPKSRPSSLREIADALALVHRELVMQAASVRTLHRIRPWLVGMSLVLALSLGAGIFAFGARRPREDASSSAPAATVPSVFAVATTAVASTPGPSAVPPLSSSVKSAHAPVPSSTSPRFPRLMRPSPAASTGAAPSAARPPAESESSAAPSSSIGRSPLLRARL